MSKTLDITSFFEQEAINLINERKKALKVHPTNIRACGNMIEKSVRDFVKERLPTRFHVGQGHLIDRRFTVSPQLDILITDVSSLPILLKTNELTDYYPIESVYAFGEVKSSYRNTSRQIAKFCDTIEEIKNEMYRDIEENTAFAGLKDNTYLHHLGVNSLAPVFNPFFSFMVFVDIGDFRVEHFSKILQSFEEKYLPNIILFLNGGVLFKSNIKEQGVSFDYHPEFSGEHSHWTFYENRETDNHLGLNLMILYFYLLMYLQGSHLRPPDYFEYFGNKMRFQKSRLNIF